MRMKFYEGSFGILVFGFTLSLFFWVGRCLVYEKQQQVWPWQWHLILHGSYWNILQKQSCCFSVAFSKRCHIDWSCTSGIHQLLRYFSSSCEMTSTVTLFIQVTTSETFGTSLLYFFFLLLLFLLLQIKTLYALSSPWNSFWLQTLSFPAPAFLQSPWLPYEYSRLPTKKNISYIPDFQSYRDYFCRTAFGNGRLVFKEHMLHNSLAA